MRRPRLLTLVLWCGLALACAPLAGAEAPAGPAGPDQAWRVLSEPEGFWGTGVDDPDGFWGDRAPDEAWGVAAVSSDRARTGEAAAALFDLIGPTGPAPSTHSTRKEFVGVHHREA
jgi:hypothetical protein